MGQFSCFLCNQLDFQRGSFIGDVHYYVPVMLATILLDNYVCKFTLPFINFPFDAIGRESNTSISFSPV